MKISIRQKLVLFSIIILASNVIIGYAVYKSNQTLRDSEQSVEQSKQLIYQSVNMLSLAKDIETASRGYVITGKNAYIEPLYAAQRTSAALFGQLRKLSKDNPGQAQRVDSMEFYLQKRLEISLRMIDVRRNEGLASAIAFSSAQHGREYMDRIRQISAAIQQDETGLLLERKQTYDLRMTESNRIMMILFVLMSIFNILLLIVLGKYLLQDKENKTHEAELVRANKELAIQNKENEKRAADLVVANEELAFHYQEKEKREDELILANAELKKSDEALRKSNKLFFKLFDHNPASIAIRSINDCKLLNVNDAFLKLFGFSTKEEVIGKSSVELNILSNSGHDAIMQNLTLMKNTDGLPANQEMSEVNYCNVIDFVKEFEIALQTKNGDTLRVSTSFLKIEVDGEPCFLTVSIDISARKKAEERLMKINEELTIHNIEKEKQTAKLILVNKTLRKAKISLVKSNKIFVKLFDRNPNAIGITNISDRKFFNVNDAFLKLYGFSDKQEVIGKSVLDIKLMTDPEHLKEVYSLVDNNAEYNFELNTQTQKGEKFWVSATYLKMEIDNNPCLFVLTVDISHRKKKEDELKALNETLISHNRQKQKQLGELIKANTALSFQSEDKETGQ